MTAALTPLTVGTAGHVDHGKTWLVRALTGKDTDRLPEEQERGVSIDLGYAPLDLPDGRPLSLVDVPGHERFVRNMVAGATGIDLFLLVVDGGEGPRRQTHEHLAILRLLDVRAGVVAVTKVDAVDAERVEATIAQARELVPDAEVVPVSAATGEGLPTLVAALARAAAQVERDRPELPTRLWIDRVFSLAGAGTVVTGTLWSGTIVVGDALVAEPGGRDARVRSVEVHDRRVERAVAGQRVAVAVAGVQRSALRRGCALVEPASYPVSYRLDVRLAEDDVPAAVTAHVGTASVAARVVRHGNYAQLRLSEAVIAARGDRVVLRTRTTISGGRVLDPGPPRGLDLERLALLDGGDAREIVRTLAREPTTATALRARALLSPAELAEGLHGLAQTDNWHYRPEWLEEQRAAVRARLARRAAEAPLAPGLPVPALLGTAPWARTILPLLGVELRDGIAFLPGTAPAVEGEAAEAASRLEVEAAAAGPAGVAVIDAEIARYLEGEGRIVRLGAGRAVSREAYERARLVAVAECKRCGAVELPRFRDALGTSRRSAQLLLERLDADGVTRRVGDARVLRRAARTRA